MGGAPALSGSASAGAAAAGSAAVSVACADAMAASAAAHASAALATKALFPIKSAELSPDLGRFARFLLEAEGAAVVDGVADGKPWAWRDGAVVEALADLSSPHLVVNVAFDVVHADAGKAWGAWLLDPVQVGAGVGVRAGVGTARWIVSGIGGRGMGGGRGSAGVRGRTERGGGMVESSGVRVDVGVGAAVGAAAVGGVGAGVGAEVGERVCEGVGAGFEEELGLGPGAAVTGRGLAAGMNVAMAVTAACGAIFVVVSLMASLLDFLVLDCSVLPVLMSLRSRWRSAYNTLAMMAAAQSPKTPRRPISS